MFKVIYELITAEQSASKKKFVPAKHCRVRDMSSFVEVTLKIEKEYNISFLHFKKISDNSPNVETLTLNINEIEMITCGLCSDPFRVNLWSCIFNKEDAHCLMKSNHVRLSPDNNGLPISFLSDFSKSL